MLSQLFPELERSMRETDLEVAQAPEGYIPHRTYLPLYLSQLWDKQIGGPNDPALDGMLGEILKVYREVRQSGDLEWLAPLWPRVKRLLEYIIARWDPDGDGVLDGKQPNTYDIDFYGPNMFIGSLWLAALRAAQELAGLQAETDLLLELRAIFKRGSERYDELLWNGEYYIQLLDSSSPKDFQYGQGCLSDQLMGQWWAHLLDLGHILPAERVKATLQSIYRYNFRRGFQGFDHDYRVFADGDESGLLVCTWPHGGRPATPVRYADEVWTGIEYQVAAHCIMEGLVDEGLQIVKALRDRYSGVRRNPYNEIECGDHYARSMAGWSVLNALSGFRCNALQHELCFAPASTDDHFQAPFITGTGWGRFEQMSDDPWTSAKLTCTFGTVDIHRLRLTPSECKTVTAAVDGEVIPAVLEHAISGTNVLLSEPLTVHCGQRLEITTHP